MSDSVTGTGWQFPPRFTSPQNGPVMLESTPLLEQSIYLLLNTQTGERPLNPEVGCGLSHFMFTETTPLMLTELKQEIASTILAYEPRIDLEEIQFDTSDIDQGRLNIVLTYRVRQTNARSNMVFPFYLNENSN
ncbi:Gene 25-like lysozyme [Vibrio aerogenes CECT 7868]|uniref:Gene 25-like lysozyme n=1 Tax=Vibrio aerogenes CECT 7868 TaxID=1216006 RepID=A0A1M5Z610_9VIBR|nr:GPW/gp25 family protein [Vibrio aerogenes]SHI19682.1 Gene 25-like lysozyme [Vibrio aerogenes CECT 7868]